MSINKRKQIIEVVPYDCNWANHFLIEATRLEKLFKENFSAIHHIGSTSIPDMPAKPTIDIVLAVKDIAKVDKLNPEMQKLGYEAWGEYNIPGRRFFVKGENKRSHHVHVFQQGSPDITRHILFRDYFIANPVDAKEYSKLKIELAEKFRHNRRAYVVGKQEFVKRLEAKALKSFQP